MFYVSQLHAGHWYISATTRESHQGLRVPFDLDHAYDTRAQAETARAEAIRRLTS